MNKARLHIAAIPAVLVNLGSLHHMQDIFDRQWVQVVFGRQGMEDVHVRKASHVNPAHNRPLWTVIGQELLQIFDFRSSYLCGQ